MTSTEFERCKHALDRLQNAFDGKPDIGREPPQSKGRLISAAELRAIVSAALGLEEVTDE